MPAMTAPGAHGPSTLQLRQDDEFSYIREPPLIPAQPRTIEYLHNARVTGEVEGAVTLETTTVTGATAQVTVRLLGSPPLLCCTVSAVGAACEQPTPGPSHGAGRWRSRLLPARGWPKSLFAPVPAACGRAGTSTDLVFRRLVFAGLLV